MGGGREVFYHSFLMLKIKMATHVVAR